MRDPHDRRRVVIQPVPHEGAGIFDQIDQAWRELRSRYSDQELSIVLNFIDAMHQMNHTMIADYHRGAANKKAEN